ncbi:hypothetical protein GALMADRAFT_141032 [Galerina marginata CBS 339.88]|uniref:Uncharacterized protein n=1 Tax=Galerina marginata (strain CBS 339.88) TaxID=685588 RepID=A0A067SUQ6_GALM3|nr:hypothetical protein GALMADRAFT_141032 [Galerina marginata CBS 339.88]
MADLHLPADSASSTKLYGEPDKTHVTKTHTSTGVSMGDQTTTSDVAIVPGPHEPSLSSIQHFLMPLIQELEES